MKTVCLPGVLLLALLGQAVAAMSIDIGPREVEAALSLARGSESSRATFHNRYVFPLRDAIVERIEVVTETRRLVQVAEARNAAGDRLFGAGSRSVQEAIQQWRRRVAIIARLRFHPQNTYVHVPVIEMVLQTASGEVSRLDIRTDPILGLAAGRPGERLPVLGASSEAIFESGGLGQTSGTVVVRLDGAVLVSQLIDFSRFE